MAAAQAGARLGRLASEPAKGQAPAGGGMGQWTPHESAICARLMAAVVASRMHHCTHARMAACALPGGSARSCCTVLLSTVSCSPGRGPRVHNLLGTAAGIGQHLAPVAHRRRIQAGPVPASKATEGQLSYRCSALHPSPALLGTPARPCGRPATRPRCQRTWWRQAGCAALAPRRAAPPRPQGRSPPPLQPPARRACRHPAQPLCREAGGVQQGGG